MKKLPVSTKVLLGFIIFLMVGFVVVGISGSSAMKNLRIKKELTELKVENVENVMEKYAKISNESKGMEYLNEVIIKNNNILSKKEKELFKAKVLMQAINTNHYSETKMFIKYNKITATKKDYEIIRDYLSDKNAFPVTIIYETMETSSLFGKFLYYDLTKTTDDTIKDLNSVKIPKAFLVIDGKLKEEYKAYSELKLKGGE